MAVEPALAVALEVARALERLGVPYLVGGSVASSLYGIPRSTQDVDLLADLRDQHVEPLVAALGDRFYVDSERVRQAVERRSSFNVIQLATMFKVDLFVLEDDPLSQAEMARRRRVRVGDGPDEHLEVASAEDTVLQKLLWYRLGSGLSDRQWGDLVGILKVQRGRLDLAYLERWAREADVVDLLHRAFTDAGVEGAE